MNVKENPSAAHQLLKRVREKDTDRLPGLHVHDLLYCARKAWFRLQHPELGKGQETDADTLVFLLGRGHHELLEHGEAEIKTVLTLFNDEDFDDDAKDIDVHGTVDGLELEPYRYADGDIDFESPGYTIPVEFKTTRSSANKSILESANYIDQLASYCLARDTHKGRLYVLYISGNYKPPSPLIKAYDFAFTVDELEDWRNQLYSRARQILGPELPDLALHWSFECDRCAIKSLINCPGGKGSYDGGFFHTLTPPWEIGELNGSK